ncbi:hypothetical protein K9M59_01240 [Candidatus Gracilibacteria bacterium]|nr:hypothetical protein [Candidatus Gracilibacteria bacterium]MCF7819192.1 hypothetical protein [Candidatus Gracilibacteria bacterium]
MGFEDLEKYLRLLFVRAESSVKNEALKKRIRLRAVEAYQTKKASPFEGWQKFFVPRVSLAAFGVAAVFVLFNLLPGNHSFLSAGEIIPKQGPVEIIRGENVILVQESMNIRQGDIIRVGNNAEADIFFPHRLSSTAKSRTQLRVVDKNSLFLEQGTLENEIFGEEGEISTSRGFVKSLPGSAFHVSVSESGETEVISSGKQVSVFDWKDGQTLLNEGEMLRLRTDTSLDHAEIPGDISLSFAQIQAIRAKLIIARTKVLTGVEKALEQNTGEAERDIRSAWRSFLSVAQVIDASRDLEIGKRKHLPQLEASNIPKMLHEKSAPSLLVKEAEAIHSLLSVSDQNLSRLSFHPEKTGPQSFQRYVLLDRLFRAANTDINEAEKRLLQEKYAVVFLRDVQNQEIKIDQISKLNEKISLLPHTSEARDFLFIVKDLFAPDMAEMIDEKINLVF